MTHLVPTAGSPAALGYRWPAEWEPHAATWLSWPHRRATWPGTFDHIPPLFARFVRTLARFEPVCILAGGEEVLADARQHVGDVAHVTLYDIPTNDAWCRDHGPIFLLGPLGRPPALVDWEYNAWGGKYPPFDLDNAVGAQVAARTGRVRFQPGIVLEGGAIDGNGQGTVLTTEQCLLNPNRNPHLDRKTIEQYLADYLGARRVLWLAGGDLAGDDTDGHVDQLARFVSHDTVVAASEKDPADANYEPLRTNLGQLRAWTNQAGQTLRVVELPLPAPVLHNGQRLPASYCNFHIANGVVLVPQFDDPADDDARRILGELFPERQVIGLPARDLVWGLGAYHCLSQQEPRPTGEDAVLT